MSRILLIEDDPLVSNIYRNRMLVEGHEVESATDGETGLEQLATFKPDAVILDLMLPGISGVEVLKTLRQDPQWLNLPVVVLSNTYLSSMIQAAWQAGASRCLSKASSTPRTVLQVIGSLLEGPAVATPRADHARTPAEAPSVLDEAAVSEFFTHLPLTLSVMRTVHARLVKEADETQRRNDLLELLQSVRQITAASSGAGFHQLAQVAEVSEALITELYDKPKNLNASTLRTLASGIDLIATLASRADRLPARNGTTKVLVVDDDALSRRAATYALEKARLGSTALECPKAALNLLSQQTFDLVLLDIEMPQINGYELCSRLRGFSANKHTPVVFVTALNNFESRANSTMSGGNDYIGKPFLFIELAAKALVNIWRAKLTPAPTR